MDLIKIPSKRGGARPGAGRKPRAKTPSGIPVDLIEQARALGLKDLAIAWLEWCAPSTPSPAALRAASYRPTGLRQIKALALYTVMQARGARVDSSPTADDWRGADATASADALRRTLGEAFSSAIDADVALEPEAPKATDPARDCVLIKAADLRSTRPIKTPPDLRSLFGLDDDDAPLADDDGGQWMDLTEPPSWDDYGAGASDD